MAAMQRVTAALRKIVPSRTKVGDTPRRPEYYDGTERPDLTPPTRYARGTKATPALPPAGL